MNEYELPELERYARPEERKSIGAAIDPATARVFFLHADVQDPYGEDPAAEGEDYNVGRVFFAVNEDGVAVCFYDIPAEIREALEQRRTAADREGWLEITKGLGEKPWVPLTQQPILIVAFTGPYDPEGVDVSVRLFTATTQAEAHRLCQIWNADERRQTRRSPGYYAGEARIVDPTDPGCSAAAWIASQWDEVEDLEREGWLEKKSEA
jgi:hypothetical protein